AAFARRSEKPDVTRARSTAVRRSRGWRSNTLRSRGRFAEIHDLLTDLGVQSGPRRAEFDASLKFPFFEGDPDGPETSLGQLKSSPVPGRFRPLTVDEAHDLELLDPAVTRGDRNAESATQLDCGYRV